MSASPVYEHQASDEVRLQYEKLKKALDVPSVPLFFTYMGSFPEYLTYITDQLVENLQNPSFKHLSDDTGNEMVGLIKDGLTKSEKLQEWLNLYGNSPSFYYFQKDIEKILSTNIRMAFIFVALREAVKGWAVAAKKLPSQTGSSQTKPSGGVKKDDFIFDIVPYRTEKAVRQKPDETVETGSVIVTTSNALAQRPSGGIEKDLLPQYLELCKFDFYQQMKRTSFWELRIALEKIILTALPVMPHLVFSPVNVVIELTQKYQDFPDLLYLLSEHFPTYAVQRMMFSGYMYN